MKSVASVMARVVSSMVFMNRLDRETKAAEFPNIVSQAGRGVLEGSDPPLAGRKELLQAPGISAHDRDRLARFAVFHDFRAKHQTLTGLCNCAVLDINGPDVIY